MRTFTLVATVIVLLANAVFVSKTNAQWQGGAIKDPRWTVEFGGRAYDRPGDDLELPLITDGITMDTLFTSSDATNLGSTVGAEIKVDFVSHRGREFEFRTILAEWDQTFEISGPNLRSPFFPVAGSEPTTVNYDYESDFFSFELMARRAITPGLTFMCGPRFVSTKDQVRLGGSLLVDPNDGSPPFLVTSTQVTEATNALIGLQAGFEFNCPVSNYFYLNAFIRTGGYMNPTEVTTTAFTNVSSLVTETQQTKTTGSFLGEVGGRGYCEIVPNCCAAYIGYEATWIDGIALAPAQLLIPAGTAGIETANTPFLQAVTFGLNFTY